MSDYKNFIGMEFVRIKPGTFMMGSPTTEQGREESETLHQVTLTREFLLQTTEVTRKQWKDLMVGDPSNFIDCGDNCAVNSVEWDWIQLFLDKLNKQDTNYHYRLPTEAEWEYAARAGTQTPFYTGNCLPPNAANFRADQPLENCPAGTWSMRVQPVRQYRPNPWGLYDMYGGVWEWCSDWFGTYPTEPVTDPVGPASGEFRSKRGGSWATGMFDQRSATRAKENDASSGFRVVAELKVPPRGK